VEETISERRIVGIEICNYLLKNLVMYLAICVVKNLCRVFINFRRVFSKTLFSSFKIASCI